MTYKITMLSFSIALATGVLAGCSQQSQQDASADASKAGSSLKQDAQKAGQEISKETATAQTELANDSVSGKIKSALMSANGLQTDLIKVDTTGKVVTLHGAVPTAAQKKQADTIAKAEVGSGYTVVDKLVVAPS